MYIYLANITVEEVRPFLNAHFLCARILSRVLVSPTGDAQQRSQYVVAAMQRYEWLAAKTPSLCRAKSVEVQEVFGDELDICGEMVRLLPSKINRIHYHGEDPLDL
jgi:hypothetical protein